MERSRIIDSLTPVISRSQAKTGLRAFWNGPMPREHPDTDTSLTLMQRLQSNPADGRAWDEFVEHYQPLIRAWCLIWGSQASDAGGVAQEVLLKLLKAMKTFQ